ncbi:MAG: SH3 domain-containing protein [Tabrizicola sp.]
MLRLTLLLCLGMFAALMTLGEDRGQLRPGLALAAAEGRLDEVWAEARARAERKPAPVVQPEPAPVVAALAPEPPPVAEPAPAVVTAAIEPVVEVQPGREVVAAVKEPVFSLSALGNEPVPGEDGAPLETAAAPEVLPGTEGTIWYVNASSVNVRAAPSTEAEVVGKLGNGEAALMVAAVDDEWARIVIQGDGLEGFVALRYLSAETP